MKKLVIDLLKFLLFCFFFYLIAIFMWGTYSPKFIKPNIHYKIGGNGDLQKRIADIKNFSEVDILFLGSSHAYRGFDTRIFSRVGLNTFNLGSSSQTPIQTQILLNRYLKTLNPKLVIFEVYPNIFSNDGVESSLDLIANDKKDKETLKMACNINNIKTYNTLVFAHMIDLLNVNKSFKESSINKEGTYITGGYVATKMAFYHPKPLLDKKIIFKDYQMQAFTEILQILKERGVQVVLVFAPVTNAEYRSFQNLNYFRKKIQNLAPYYDFNQLLQLNDTLHFVDSHHLNQNGVELFNQKLIQVLKLGKVEIQ